MHEEKRKREGNGRVGSNAEREAGGYQGLREPLKRENEAL